MDQNCASWRIPIRKFAKKAMKILSSDETYKHVSFGFCRGFPPAFVTARAISFNRHRSDCSLPFRLSRNDVTMLRNVLEDGEDSSAHSSGSESVTKSLHREERMLQKERKAILGREVPMIEITHDSCEAERRIYQSMPNIQHPNTYHEHPGKQKQHPGMQRDRHEQALLSERETSSIMMQLASRHRDFETNQRLSTSSPHIYRPGNNRLTGICLASNSRSSRYEDDYSDDAASTVTSDSRIFRPIKHMYGSRDSSSSFVIGQTHSKSQNCENVARKREQSRTSGADENISGFRASVSSLICLEFTVEFVRRTL